MFTCHIHFLSSSPALKHYMYKQLTDWQKLITVIGNYLYGKTFFSLISFWVCMCSKKKRKHIGVLELSFGMHGYFFPWKSENSFICIFLACHFKPKYTHILQTAKHVKSLANLGHNQLPVGSISPLGEYIPQGLLYPQGECVGLGLTLAGALLFQHYWQVV